ncbi:hypothetical protein DW322_09955 [Rhodococcus rhodnii]|uniref:Uncharacterized protein n=2 Tax=Rhodococcus rhodnii TaxID=38312 RepID=R7WJL4_9NOCA|nr:hypothetical protein [Rhodococcus rhodnii]EOM75501.1 hypothetical protein Rrhod_3299 [Rhodococcus rhodnii LMG 5362]TXG90486.1 hypothetical protein DW322_09955 [Rhodococcus rhodnii]
MPFTSLDRRLVGWSALFVVSQSLIGAVLGPAAPRVLQGQTAMSARAYREVLESMDDAETARYRRHFYLDFVHPLVFAIALRTGVKRLSELTSISPRTRSALLAAASVSAAADYAENVVGLYLLDHREAISDPVVRATSTVSITKWVLALGTFGCLAQGFVRFWGSNLRNS